MNDALPEDWQRTTVARIVAAGGSIKTGPFGTLLRASEFSNEGVPIISVGEIGDGVLRISGTTPMAPPEVVRRLPDYCLKVGDVVFARKGAVDRSALVVAGQDGWFLGSDGIRLRLPGSYFPDFVARQFRTASLRTWLMANATGSTMATLNESVLARASIAVAPFTEQRTIANVLSDVDGLIAVLVGLIDKKQAVMQAVTQQLLTGRTRMPGCSGVWRTMRLGQVGAFTKGRGIKRDDLSDVGVPCIRYGELYTRYRDYITAPVSRIPPAVARTALPIRTGDLLFAGSGETSEEIGRCAAYLGGEQAYAGGDIVVLTPVGHDAMFLGHLMNHPSVAAQKARFGQGDAVVHISAANLGRVEVRLPPLAEQRAIAAVLSDMDQEIAALERRLVETRAIKQGMMQQLLTGRVRLVPPEVAAAP